MRFAKHLLSAGVGPASDGVGEQYLVVIEADPCLGGSLSHSRGCHVAIRTTFSHSPLRSHSVLHCEISMTGETGEAFPGKVELKPTPESCIKKLDSCRQRAS